ncbi:MAG: hypothetical protein QXX38_03275 [Candidatus Aenigmatarchaeota archaeon]
MFEEEKELNALNSRIQTGVNLSLQILELFTKNEIQSEDDIKEIKAILTYPDGNIQETSVKEKRKSNDNYIFRVSFYTNKVGTHLISIEAINKEGIKSKPFSTTFDIGLSTKEKNEATNPALFDKYLSVILSDKTTLKEKATKLKVEDLEKIIKNDYPIISHFNELNDAALKYLYFESFFHLPHNHIETHSMEKILKIVELIDQNPELVENLLPEGCDIYPHLIDLVDLEKAKNDLYYSSVLHGLAWFGQYWFYSVNKLEDTHYKKGPFGPMADGVLDDIEKEILRTRFKQMVEGENLIPPDVPDNIKKNIILQSTLPYSLLWQNIYNPNDDLLPYVYDGYFGIKGTDYAFPSDTKHVRDMLYKNVIERIPKRKKEIYRILEDPSLSEMEINNFKKYFTRYQRDWPKFASEFPKLVDFMFKEGIFGDRAWLVIEGISCEEIERLPYIEPREFHLVNLMAAANGAGYTFVIQYPKSSVMSGKFHSTSGASISSHLRDRLFERYGSILIHKDLNAICPWLTEDFLEDQRHLTIQYAFRVDKLI